MTTTVLTPGDYNKLQRQVDDLVARVSALEAKPVDAPVVEPPAEDPPVVPVPPVAGTYAIAQRTGDLPKIIRSPADLVAAKLMLPFGTAVNPPQYPTYARGSYQSVGLTPYMPQTGERQEIGLVTDAQGMWLAGGSPNNMLIQAEAHADVPVHFGKIDIFATPNASAYADKNVADPWLDTSGHDVTPEGAHYPSLSYVPYLATGDDYYLRELQAGVTFCLIQGPPLYRFNVNAGQPRALAWLLRGLTEAYLTAPDDETADLLPKAYWKRVLDTYRDAIIATFVNSTDPRIQAFRNMVIDLNGWVAPWEQDYLGSVLGSMVWRGLDDWREIYTWQVRQALDRAAYGERAIGYHWMIGNATDYASLLAANPAMDMDYNYLSTWRADLKIAVLNGVSGADVAFAVADGITPQFRPYKWAV